MSRLVATAALLGLVAGPAAAATLDEVLARHERARGGKARWEAVRSLTLKGEQETFSLVSPFTLIRAQPGRMRWEYDALGKPTVVAWDGEAGWWIEPLFGPWPTPLPTQNRKMLARDAQIVPPLLAIGLALVFKDVLRLDDAAMSLEAYRLSLGDPAVDVHAVPVGSATPRHCPQLSECSYTFLRGEVL